MPLNFDEELHLPLPDLRYWTGHASFNDAPVAVLSAPVSLVGSGRRTLDGQVRAWSDGDDFHLRGEVQLGRGKQFDFGRSTLRFAGGRQINPRLDVTPVHTLADNNSVTVKLTGMLLSPELNLSTSVAGVETEAEILALLVGGRSSSASGQIENEAAGFLAGLTAGVLSSLTRRRIGEYVPVFGIETDGARANRIRAAIQTDRLIPDFLENVVLGAHIESF